MQENRSRANDRAAGSTRNGSVTNDVVQKMVPVSGPQTQAIVPNADVQTSEAVPPVKAVPFRIGLPPATGRTAQQWRRFWIAVSFALCVLLPVAAASVYYAFIATDRYVVEVKFAIRSPSMTQPADLMGLMTGAGGVTVTDSYMVVDYLQSRGFVDELEERLDLVAIYNHPDADFLTRLDPTEPKERVVKYLHRMVSVNYDTSSQIITVAVQAFTPQDASRLAQEILALSNDLVNQVSAKSRQDTVRLAESELQRAEARLREQRDVLSAFRETEQDIDPAGSVATQQAMIGRLMGELTGAQTRMATLREYLSDDAPSVRVLASLISTLEDQVEVEKAKLGRGDAAIGTGDTLTERVGTFEELSVDLEFTRRAYLSALVSVEGARLEADRQQRYLASFVSPSLPEQALYPKRVLNVFLAAVLAFMLWGIAVMSVYIVREHMT